MRLFFVLTILCITQTVNAQILQISKADSLWHLKITAAGNYTDGNQPRTLFTNKANLSKAGKKIGFISNNTYQYGTVSFSGRKIVTYNDVRSENLLVLLPKSRFSPFARVFLETNIIRKIDFRNEFAVGSFYKLMNKPNHSLSILVAGVNQQTNYVGNVFNIIDNNGSDKRNVWKWATGISGTSTIIKNHISLDYRAFYMQNIELAKDYNYLIDLILNVKITKGLSFNVEYFRTFENVEQEKVLPKEVQINYGFSYQF